MESLSMHAVRIYRLPRSPNLDGTGLFACNIMHIRTPAHGVAVHVLQHELIRRQVRITKIKLHLRKCPSRNMCSAAGPQDSQTGFLSHDFRWIENRSGYIKINSKFTPCNLAWIPRAFQTTSLIIRCKIFQLLVHCYHLCDARMIYENDWSTCLMMLSASSESISIVLLGSDSAVTVSLGTFASLTACMCRVPPPHKQAEATISQDLERHIHLYQLDTSLDTCARENVQSPGALDIQPYSCDCAESAEIWKTCRSTLACGDVLSEKKHGVPIVMLWQHSGLACTKIFCGYGLWL